MFVHTRMHSLALPHQAKARHSWHGMVRFVMMCVRVFIHVVILEAIFSKVVCHRSIKFCIHVHLGLSNANLVFGKL